MRIFKTRRLEGINISSQQSDEKFAKELLSLVDEFSETNSKELKTDDDNVENKTSTLGEFGG